jgi:hypothetical protein
VASTANPVAPRIKAGVAPLRAGEGTRSCCAVCIPQRRRAHRSLSPRTLHLQRRSLQGPAGLRKASRVSEQPARRFSAGAVLHLDSDPLPRPLRRLHLVSRRHQRRRAIRGAATGSTPRSAGPASSRSPTWCSTPITCASPACTCRRIPCSRSPRSRENFRIRGWSPSTRRHHRRVVAFQLRPVAVRREVGDHDRRTARTALAISVSRSPSDGFARRRPACTGFLKTPPQPLDSVHIGKHRNAVAVDIVLVGHVFSRASPGMLTTSGFSP